jgi:hypothetical protein
MRQDAGVRWAAFLLALPFFLQLLGFGSTPLGGGLCGELFRGRETPLALQGAGFWYALVFMMLLLGQLGYAGLLALAGFLELPPLWLRSIYRLGSYYAAGMTLLFVVTRTTGLPVPAPQGWVLGDVAPVDLLGLLGVGLTLAGGVLLWGISRPNTPQPS